MNKKSPAVELSNVEKRYDETVVAVKDVSLEFSRGPMDDDHGPFRLGRDDAAEHDLLPGTRPTSRKIRVLGRDLNDMTDAELARCSGVITSAGNPGQYHLMPLPERAGGA